MTLPIDLSDIRNHLYQRAEQWWIVSLLISVVTLCLVLIALWIDSSPWVSLAGIFAILAPVSIAWAREAASASLLRGDKCRRLILYADGLGHDIPPEDLAEVKVWALGSQLKEAPFVKPYYSSSKSPGPQRLADIIAESSFFTEHLARKIATGLWVTFGIALIVACLVLYSADLGAGVSYRVAVFVMKSMAVLVSFLIAGDFLLIAKKYTDLNHEAHQAFSRCARLREAQNLSIDEVRNVVEDYGVALLQAPPIPGKLYGFYRDALNRIYRESHGGSA